MRATYLALLRGINVGGKNRIPMNDLAGLFAGAGCTDVRTYIQSGNVVFAADSDAVDTLPARITEAVADRFGPRVPVVLRSVEQMQAAIAGNPFLGGGMPEEHLHVLFLADSPEPARVAALDHGRSLPDAFAVLSREVYLYLPNGVARTKLTNEYFDSKLATVSTGRNWRTAVRLAEMMVV